MRAALFVVAIAAACGGPALQNVPQPNKAIAAGVVAGAAAAMTLADPDAAARRQEDKKQEPDKKPVANDTNVPSDVLDRLDQKKATPAAPASATEPEAEEKPANPALDFERPAPP